MANWEYYAEAVAAGSYRPLYGGDSAEESLRKLTARLNVVGASGWKLMSIEHRIQTFENDAADPKTCYVYYDCIFMREVPTAG